MDGSEWESPPVGEADLRAALLELPEPLEVMARGVLGCGGRIDLVARDGQGRVGLIQRAAPGRDLETWAELMAHLGWLVPRLADWHQLAPERRLDPGLTPRALLLARDFDERTRQAAPLSSPAVELWRLVPSRTGAALAPDGGHASRPWAGVEVPGSGPPSRAPASRFRTRLGRDDL